jgi:hypothetical protein
MAFGLLRGPQRDLSSKITSHNEIPQSGVAQILGDVVVDEGFRMQAYSMR